MPNEADDVHDDDDHTIRTTARAGARCCARGWRPGRRRPCRGSAGPRRRKWREDMARAARRLAGAARRAAAARGAARVGEPVARELALRSPQPARRRLARHGREPERRRRGTCWARSSARAGSIRFAGSSRSRASWASSPAARASAIPATTRWWCSAIPAGNGSLGLALRGASPLDQRAGGARPRRGRDAGLLRRQSRARAPGPRTRRLPAGRRGGGCGLLADRSRWRAACARRR